MDSAPFGAHFAAFDARGSIGPQRDRRYEFVIMPIAIAGPSHAEAQSLPGCVEVRHSGDGFRFGHGMHLGLRDAGLLGQRADHSDRNGLNDRLHLPPVR